MHDQQAGEDDGGGWDAAGPSGGRCRDEYGGLCGPARQHLCDRWAGFGGAAVWIRRLSAVSLPLGV